MIPSPRFRSAAALAAAIAFGLFLYTAVARVSQSSGAEPVALRQAPAVTATEPMFEVAPVTSPRPVRHASRSRAQTYVPSQASSLSPVNPKAFGFIWPVGNRAMITSPFGPRKSGFHHGVDIGCSVGTPIAASQTGRVLYAAEAKEYGNVVLLDNGSGYQTLYAHLSEIDSTVGQVIPRGRALGRCGQTGNATGPHLHFEVRYGGYVWDPLTFLP